MTEPLARDQRVFSRNRTGVGMNGGEVVKLLSWKFFGIRLVRRVATVIVCLPYVPRSVEAWLLDQLVPSDGWRPLVNSEDPK